MSLRPLMMLLLTAAASPRPGSPYPISATWMFGRSTQEQWLQALDDFGSIGGNTVLMFGNAVQRYQKDGAGRGGGGRGASASASADAPSGCVVPGTQIPCANASAAAIRALGAVVGHVVSYSALTRFDPRSVVPCADVNGTASLRGGGGQGGGVGTAALELHIPASAETGFNEYWVAALSRNATGKVFNGAADDDGEAKAAVQLTLGACTLPRAGDVVDILIAVLPGATSSAANTTTTAPSSSPTAPGVDQAALLLAAAASRPPAPDNSISSTSSTSSTIATITTNTANKNSNKSNATTITTSVGTTALLPMPALPVLPPPNTWEVDASLVPVFLAWVQRTTLDHLARGHADSPAFEGFYQVCWYTDGVKDGRLD